MAVDSDFCIRLQPVRLRRSSNLLPPFPFCGGTQGRAGEAVARPPGAVAGGVRGGGFSGRKKRRRTTRDPRTQFGCTQGIAKEDLGRSCRLEPHPKPTVCDPAGTRSAEVERRASVSWGGCSLRRRDGRVCDCKEPPGHGRLATEYISRCSAMLTGQHEGLRVPTTSQNAGLCSQESAGSL